MTDDDVTGGKQARSSVDVFHTWHKPSGDFLEIACCAGCLMNTEDSLGNDVDGKHEEDVCNHLVDKHDRDTEDHRVVAGEDLECVA